MRSLRLVPCLGFFLAIGCSDSLSSAEWHQMAEQAAVCSEGEQCVLADRADCQCVCPVPINAAEADRIRDAAERVDCSPGLFDDPMQVKCAACPSAPRCEEGRCTCR